MTPNSTASPAPVSASTVVRSDFALVRKGFDPHEVAAHLGRVADHVADLEERIADLERRLIEQERAMPPDQALRNEAYEQTASRIADLVRAFDQDMGRLRAEAAAEADRVVREATTEAERILTESRALAEQTLSVLHERRTVLLENVRRIRQGLVRTTESVDAVLGEADVVRVPDAADQASPAAG
jgi:cell division septum initiation protein DivIVA